MAFIGSDRLEVRTVDGSVYRWEREGGAAPGVSVARAPQARWAALQTHQPGNVVFLKR